MNISKTKRYTYHPNFTAVKISQSAITNMLNDNKSVAEISEITGINLRTLYDFIKKLNLKTPRQMKTENSEKIMQQVTEQNRNFNNINEIIEATGLRQSWISAWLKKTQTQTPTQKRQALIRELIESRTLDDEIAEKTGLSKNSIRSKRRKMGVNAHKVKEKLINEQIIAAKAEGMNNVQIAQKLNISTSTVQRHLAKMKTQLDIEV